MATWTRVDDGHPRWEIHSPNGDGRNYLLTDEAIRTFGRGHCEQLLAVLPPLPEEAWTPPTQKDVTITTNQEADLGKAIDEPVCPVSVPVRTPQDMTARFPGMTLVQAMTLLAEADQAHAGDQAETLGMFIREERDPFTRALIYGQRWKVSRQAGGTYLVTVTDEEGQPEREAGR